MGALNRLLLRWHHKQSFQVKVEDFEESSIVHLLDLLLYSAPVRVVYKF